MSLYANVDGIRARAELSAPRRAHCPGCNAVMIAKLGSVMVHHWAHESKSDGCAWSNESDWHREWKSLAIEGTQEIVKGNRCADVLAPADYAIEFQASPLTAEEVSAREADWGYRLVWVFDAREAYRADRLKIWPNHNMFWFKAPERIRAARCATYYDIGNEQVIRVTELRVSGTCIRGTGYKVSKRRIVSSVLRAKTVSDWFRVPQRDGEL